jgi:hypothetical protein
MRSALSNYSGVASSIEFDGSKCAMQELLVSLVLSDVTTIDTVGGGQQFQIILDETRGKITVPNAILSKIAARKDGTPKFACLGRIVRNDPEIISFLDEVEPLVNTGRILVRPYPLALFLSNELDLSGQHIVEGKRIEPNLPCDAWQVMDSLDSIMDGKSQITRPIRTGRGDGRLERTRATLSLPFLEGISLENLAKILNDEQPYLAELRAGVRKLLTEAAKQDSNEIDALNDLVRPAVERVNRRFKEIESSYHKKIVGFTIGVATMSLAALTTAGLSAAISGVFGVGSFGLLMKEYADKGRSMSELREHPAYLLWRIRKANQKI